jgi:hypothetical protein
LVISFSPGAPAGESLDQSRFGFVVGGSIGAEDVVEPGAAPSNPAADRRASPAATQSAIPPRFTIDDFLTFASPVGTINNGFSSRRSHLCGSHVLGTNRHDRQFVFQRQRLPRRRWR